MSTRSSIQELYRIGRQAGRSEGASASAGTALLVGRVESAGAGVHRVQPLDEEGLAVGAPIDGVRTVPAAQTLSPGTLVVVVLQPPALPAILLTSYSGPNTSTGAYLSSRYFTSG